MYIINNKSNTVCSLRLLNIICSVCKKNEINVFKCNGVFLKRMLRNCSCSWRNEMMITMD